MGEFTGLYPGTFDPVTLGHLDIIMRASGIFDRLVVGVARNDGKGPLFTTDERVALIEADIAPLRAKGFRIEVKPFDNLLISFAAGIGAKAIIRGLRAVSDFEYEFQMAGMNARLDRQIETMFLMASDRCQFISSRFVKEIATLDGNIRPFVSEATALAVQAKLSAKRSQK